MIPRFQKERATGALRAAAVGFALACGAAALPMALITAQAAEPKPRIEISGGPAGQALKQFVAQTGLQLLFDFEAVNSLTTQPVSGELNASEALTRMLAGTGLAFEFVNDRTVTVTLQGASKRKTPDAVSTVSSPGSEDLPAKTADQGMRLAQAEDTTGKADWSSAQEENKAAGQSVQEVVVTAQRREENLQDVPISISVLSGDALDRSSFSGISEALRTVAGLDTSVDQYAGGAMISLRGVSNSSGRYAGSGTVAYYIDGVPYGFIRNSFYPNDPSAYDLKQLEVLSGPQGTLYGANALNGVVRIITNDADVNAFEFKTRASLGSVDDAGENLRADAALNVPIIEGVLAARATLGYQNDDGWIDSPAKKGINDKQTHNYRLRLRAEPVDSFSASFSAWRSEQKWGAPPFSDDDRRVTTVVDQRGDQRFDTYSLELRKQFIPFELTSTSSYLDFDTFGIVSGTPVGAPATIDTNFNSTIFTQEINLISSNEGRLRWSAGVFYRDAKETTDADLVFLIPVPTLGLEDYEDTSESAAVYGEVGLQLSDQWDVTAGLRYFRDEQTLRLTQVYGGTFVLPVGAQFDATSEAVTPRAVLTWRPSDTRSFYLGYGQGFRSGFAQLPSVQVTFPNFIPLEPDKLTTIEAGVKGSALQGRMRYEAAVFYQDWRKIQQSVTVYITPITTQPAMINGASASGPGASLLLDIEPLEGLVFNVNTSWNDLTFDSRVADAAGNVLFAKGSRANFSPEFTLNSSISYRFGLGASDLTGQVSLSGEHKFPQSSVDFETGTYESPSLTTASANFSIESSNHWRAMLFADNVTNEYTSQGFNLGIPEWSPRIRPRTIGLQLEYRY